MALVENYDIFFGLNGGSLLHWQKKRPASYHIIIKAKDVSSVKTSVSTLSWGRTVDEIIIGYSNGTWNSYDVKTGTLDQGPSLGPGRDVVVGLVPFDDSVFVATRNGLVHVMTDDVYTPFVECDTNAFKLANRSIEKVVHNPYCKSVMGLGGNNYDLRLYDIESKKPFFTAKSDPHDSLNLAKEVSVTGISFFENLAGLEVSTITRQGQIRLFDTRVQRKAVKAFKAEKVAYSSISTTNRDYQIVTGSTTGYMQLMDLRRDIKPIKTLKGYMGSVIDIYSDLKTPIIFSCSLERYLKLHNLESFEVIYEEYLKISINSMLVRPMNSPVAASSSLADLDEIPNKKLKLNE